MGLESQSAINPHHKSRPIKQDQPSIAWIKFITPSSSFGPSLECHALESTQISWISPLSAYLIFLVLFLAIGPTRTCNGSLNACWFSSKILQTPTKSPNINIWGETIQTPIKLPSTNIWGETLQTLIKLPSTNIWEETLQTPIKQPNTYKRGETLPTVIKQPNTYKWGETLQTPTFGDRQPKAKVHQDFNLLDHKFKPIKPKEGSTLMSQEIIEDVLNSIQEG